MYLHLGEKTVVSAKEVIGIFDLDTSTVGKSTRDFLATAEKSGMVINVSYELPKSFVLCAPTGIKSSGITKKAVKKKLQPTKNPSFPPPEGARALVYISQISSSTLLKRSQSLDEIKNVK